MTTILDDQLYLHSDRLAGRVVLITGEYLTVLACVLGAAIEVHHTGGGAGIGRETALQCAKHKYVASYVSPESELIVRPALLPGPGLCWAISTNPWYRT